MPSTSISVWVPSTAEGRHISVHYLDQIHTELERLGRYGVSVRFVATGYADEDDDLEQEQPEPGGLADGGVPGEPDRRLPQGHPEDGEQPDERRPGREVAPPPRHRDQLPHEDRAEH